MGFGSVIRDNRFLVMNRMVYARTGVNGVVIANNYVQGGQQHRPVRSSN